MARREKILRLVAQLPETEEAAVEARAAVGRAEVISHEGLMLEMGL